MKTLLFLHCLGITVLFSMAATQVEKRIMPSITHPDRAMVRYYANKQEVELKCKADGTPPISYQWLRDETPFSSNKDIQFDSKTGTLKIPSYTSRENGVYTCVASNVFGGQKPVATFSHPQTLLESEVNFISGAEDKKFGPVMQYSYTMLECRGKGNIAGSPGDITYKWYIKEKGNQLKFEDGRRFISSDGNLHFTYVKTDDQLKGDLSYRCGISSVSLNVIKMGPSDKLVVTPADSKALKPDLMYSNTNLQAMIHTDAKLECVFSGYDPSPSVTDNLPSINWYDLAGKKIVAGDKYTLDNKNRVLTIKNLVEVDDGTYHCEGSTSAGVSGRRPVNLNVTSPPIFVDPPKSDTIPEGKNAVFNCKARSLSNEDDPQKPTWYVNGRKAGADLDFHKYDFATNGLKLTIKNTAKKTDNMCVQCVVKNSVGQVMGDACLNVLVPIKILTRPPAVQKVDYGEIIYLSVNATTDPSYMLNLLYEWMIKNSTYTLPNLPPFVTYDDVTKMAIINTSLITREEFETLGGVYTCKVYHPYDVQYVHTEIVLENITPGPVIASAGFDMWIIGLIIGIIFLLIVVILIIFVICRKKQEGDYNVDKKETGAGLDPAKELKEKGFNDFSRPDYDDYEFPDKKPKGDLEYDDVPIGGDDESLAEYGDEEDTHFNEDGSFIGIYDMNDRDRDRQPHSTESTI